MQRFTLDPELILLLLFSFLTSGCASASDSPPLALASSNGGDAMDADRQAIEYAQVGEFLYEALPFLATKRYTQIKAMKGLLSESCVTEPSYKRGQTQQRCTLVFKGLELSGVVHEDQLALNYAVISSPKWQLRWGLNVGTPLANLKTKFKQSPEHPAPDVLYYGDESSSVSFFIKDGLIARVALTLYDG